MYFNLYTNVVLDKNETWYYATFRPKSHLQHRQLSKWCRNNCKGSFALNITQTGVQFDNASKNMVPVVFASLAFSDKSDLVTLSLTFDDVTYTNLIDSNMTYMLYKVTNNE